MSTATDHSLNTARYTISADMDAVNRGHPARLHSESRWSTRSREYIISAGGKRIRPQLVLLFANAYGYRGTHHHELAAVVEFIHTATLLHDDVVDESSLRRGARPPMRCSAMQPRCWSAISCIRAHSR